MSELERPAGRQVGDRGLGVDGLSDADLSDDGRRGEGVRKRFDPRFSPAFQPGYDPRVHRETPPSAPLRQEPRQDWSLGVTAPAQPRRDAPDPGEEFPVFALPEGAAETAEAGTEPEAPEPAPWWHRINPWLIVLWVLGLAILLGAFQLVNVVFDLAASQGPNSGGLGYFMSVLPQMMIFGLPSLVSLGLAVFVTPFVILAARWHRA